MRKCHLYISQGLACTVCRTQLHPWTRNGISARGSNYTRLRQRRRPVHPRSAKPFSHADSFPRPEIASSRLWGNNKAARHSHMNCAPTGAGYRIHQSTWWSTINMQQPPHALLSRFCPFPFFLLSLSLFLALFLSYIHTHTHRVASTHVHTRTALSSFSSPLEKARFVSPQRALLQVPDWLLNWHSLKYPSNACRERYVWTKKTVLVACRWLRRAANPVEGPPLIHRAWMKAAKEERRCVSGSIEFPLTLDEHRFSC